MATKKKRSPTADRIRIEAAWETRKVDAAVQRLRAVAIDVAACALTGAIRKGAAAEKRLRAAAIAYTRAFDARNTLTEKVDDGSVKTPAAKRAPKRFTVVVQEWEESERGWGVRPDGASLHLDETSRKAFVDQFWADEKKNNPSGVVPDEYSRTRGEPTIMDVDAATYRRILESRTKNGLWLLQLDYSKLQAEGQAKKGI